MDDRVVAGEQEGADYPGSAEPVETSPSHLAELSATLQPSINAALWQNHVPVLMELTLRAGTQEALGDVTIDLVCEPAVIGPRSWRLQGIGPGQVRPLQDLDLALDGAMLTGLTEGTRATALFTARRGGPDGEVVAELRRDLRVLAHNEWGGSSGIPDMLAAFVEPNDPAVAKILRLASDQLRARGKSDGLEGYQAPSKARVWEQAEALWRAVRSLDIRYVNPPPSFERTGQRIRPPRQILEERLATCLDLAVLFAGCLEAIGLRPVIVLVREHAFAGFWLTRHDFGSSVADDAPGLRTRLALHDLLLFETTLVCGRGGTGFKRACEAGAAHVAPDKDDAFEAVIDVHRARQRRIRPLAAGGAGYALRADATEDDSPLAELPVEEPPLLREDPQTEPEPAPATPADRLERWRRRLLDLSGRNRLLNLRTGGKQALAIDCPDPAHLENMLAEMRGRAKAAPLRFRPWPDLMTGADPRSAKLHRARLQEEADRAFARDALARRELVVGRDEAALQASLTEIFRAARAAQQEGGANTLFLTIGALLWRQKGKEAPYRAPIILVPVVLERPSVRSGFSLRAHDDETRLNATLLEMLKQEFAIRFPALETEGPPEDEAGFDVQAILDTFRAKLRDIPGWEVTEEVALTNLSFTKYLMWKDLADRADALRESELARRLMDGPAREGSDAGLPATEASDAARTPADLDEGAADLVCPLEADSSQLRAVATAGAGKSFVLIGPPGTGKSQTIANIIANTLAQGRTVLFVAEKRAALEVVQRRLRHVGLGDFCLDLFSAKTSKAAVLEQMNRAQQAREEFNPHEWHAAAEETAALRAELNGYVRELHRRGRNGWTPFSAMGCVLRAEAGGVPEVMLAWPDAGAHDAGDYQRLTELVEDAAATLARVGDVASAAALSGVEATDWSPPWQGRLLDAAATAAARLTVLPDAVASAARALALASVPASRPALAALDALAGALLDPLAGDGAWALTEGAEATMEAVRAEVARIARHREVRGTLSASWRPGAMALPLKDIKAEWDSAAARWAVPRALAHRALRRRLAAEASGPVPADCGAELGRLIELQEIEAVVAAAGGRLAAPLGPRWRGLETDFARLEAGFEWARRLRGAAAGCASDPATLLSLREHLRRLVGEGADLLAPTGAVGAVLGRLRAAQAEAQSAMEALAPICGADPYSILDSTRDDWATALAEHLKGWTGAARHLKDWTSWRGVTQRADALGLAPLLRAMETGLVAPADAPRVFEANYARWWVGLAVEASPRLRGFVAAQHEKRIERFRTLDARMLELATRLTRARLAGAIPGKAQRERDPEYAVLARELVKRQRHLPVRQLAARMPQALRRLTPCLMMSPLSVAQYLPADAKPFDLVVFDEASQIPTWDAVGAIGRGRQVVVVGDPKQLPPTRFFERQLPDGDGEGEAVEVEVQDLESILDECLGAGVPAVELTWHYRSRHESLIAFSNQAYYGGRLVTFPSPVTRDGAVSFRHVPDGVYARAGARTNLPEARAVVAEALALLRGVLAGGRPRSLGIVTFNAEQQALIENLLDEARREDPSLEPFFSDDAAEPVLVKNLESVQGEERDVMLFSLTYGPDQSGRVAMNFGPLNQAGGERRLNVAVTRAREALIAFGSLRPEQIDLARTSATGVAHLKQFLAFAQHGARAFAMTATGPLGDYESPFEAAVAERLRARGWTVHPQIGVSGFRIDLGVVDPEAPGAFLAGVECDGATYHRGATARDRDRLRQVVLEGLGWRILRIWSTDWWTNAAREADRLHVALEAALAEARAERDAKRPIADIKETPAPPSEEAKALQEADCFAPGEGASPPIHTGLPP
jgi:very-short-patch-repair endonuclease